jgi:hypothetical protein
VGVVMMFCAYYVQALKYLVAGSVGLSLDDDILNQVLFALLCALQQYFRVQEFRSRIMKWINTGIKETMKMM